MSTLTEEAYQAGYEDGRSSESSTNQELQQRAYRLGWSDGYDASVEKLKKIYEEARRALEKEKEKEEGQNASVSVTDRDIK